MNEEEDSEIAGNGNEEDRDDSDESDDEREEDLEDLDEEADDENEEDLEDRNYSDKAGNRNEGDSENPGEDSDANEINLETKRKQIQRTANDVSKASQKLSIEEKRDVIRKSLEKGREECLTEIVHSNSESVFEGKLCTGILEYIKKLQQKKKQKELFNMIDMFPEINDEFLKWIAKKTA